MESIPITHVSRLGGNNDATTMDENRGRHRVDPLNHHISSLHRGTLWREIFLTAK